MDFVCVCVEKTLAQRIQIMWIQQIDYWKGGTEYKAAPLYLESPSILPLLKWWGDKIQKSKLPTIDQDQRWSGRKMAGVQISNVTVQQTTFK